MKKRKFYWPEFGFNLDTLLYWGLTILILAVILSGGWGLFQRLH